MLSACSDGLVEWVEVVCVAGEVCVVLVERVEGVLCVEGLTVLPAETSERMETGSRLNLFFPHAKIEISPR